MYAHKVLSLSENAVNGDCRTELLQPVQAVNPILVVEVSCRLLNARTRECDTLRLIGIRRGGEIAESVFLPPRIEESELLVRWIQP